MKPQPDDVLHMVGSLMKVIGSIERARRQGDAAHLSILNILAIRGSIRPSDIATELGVHQSTVTRQVQALEEQGYVQVTADAEDRRSCSIALSETGRQELARLTEVGLSRFALFVADWEADEVRTLARLLTKLEESKAKLAPPEPQKGGRKWQTNS